MITGFNTDVEFEGVTYHVQTEDKGLETPFILSLVYHRGTILASKRSPYEDLLKGKLDESTLAERLQKQHKLICAAIRGGRLEDLKRMTMKDSEARKAVAVAARITNNKAENQTKAEPFKAEAAQNQPLEVKDAAPLVPEITSIAEKITVAPEKYMTAPPVTVMRTAARIEQKLAEKIDHAKAEFPVTPTAGKISSNGSRLKSAETAGKSLPIPQPPTVWKEKTPVVEAEPIIEAVEIIDEEMILPAEAVAVVSAEILNSKNLEIDFLNETEFKGGDRKTVSIIVWRGDRENGIAGAQVMVKILGSSFRPMIFHAQTDTNGVATVHLQLPHFRAGRAAILVRALIGGEEIEMRRVITHG